MGKPTSPEAIAKWAAQQTTPACKPAYKRLTDEDRILAQELRKRGHTQAEIAQQIGCTQQAVSDWLRKVTDTTSVASLYLRGQALRMARNIVKAGRASDHIKALEGIKVLAPDQRAGITVQIGISADRVKLITPTFASETSTVS